MQKGEEGGGSKSKGCFTAGRGRNVDGRGGVVNIASSKEDRVKWVL